MVMKSFDIDKEDWDIFLQQVGWGNASATLRNYIRSYGEKTNISEKKLRQEFDITDEEYKKIKAKWERQKSKIEAIHQKRKQEELEQLAKKEKELDKLRDLKHQQMKEELRRVA